MKKFLIFISIILLAVFLRLYQITTVPPSASLDEVSIGYNAYSILKTGADEYGTKFPLLLRAYDDWRPALYVYLVIPFIKLFGLNALAIRLPSVILSVLTVVATYFLVKELFPKAKQFSIFNFQFSIGEIAMLFLAISPWHIYISRLGHEANAGLAFLIFAVLFFLIYRFYLSSLFFVLSFMSYQSEKIFIPIFLIGLFFIFKEKIISLQKKTILSLLIAIIILIPFVKETFSPNALIRFQATNITNSYQERFEKEAKFLNLAVERNDVIGKIVHNRRIVTTTIFIENYFSHFNPEWLFANPSNDRHKVPGIGLFYIWEAPLILLGLVFLLRSKMSRKIKYLLASWILLAPVSAAITTDAPHAMRIYTMLPTPQIIESLGLISLISFFSKYKLSSIKYHVLSFCLLIVILSLVYFYRQYFLVFPKTQSSSFQYALSRVINFVLENEGQYDKIIFSNQDNLYQSYMFFLFYSRYDPKLYQKQEGTVSGGFAQTHKFGRFEFRPIEWVKEEKSSQILYIGNVPDFPQTVKSILISYHLNGEAVIKAVKEQN